ncbi:unnamed protein product, partial [Polarella glacialis]
MLAMPFTLLLMRDPKLPLHGKRKNITKASNMKVANALNEEQEVEPTSEIDLPDVHSADFGGARLPFKILSLSRPGYGCSTRGPSTTAATWTYEDLATEVGTLAAALGIDSFSPLGCSSGGPCCLAYTHYLKPTVTGVLILSGDANFGPGMPKGKRMNAPQSDPVALKDLGFEISPAALYRVPVVFYHGDADDVVDVNCARHRKALLPHATLHIVPKMPHAVLKADLFDKALSEFRQTVVTVAADRGGASTPKQEASSGILCDSVFQSLADCFDVQPALEGGKVRHGISSCSLWIIFTLRAFTVGTSISTSHGEKPGCAREVVPLGRVYWGFEVGLCEVTFRSPKSISKWRSRLPFATCCKPLLLRELRSPADAASHLPPSGLTARHADEQDEQETSSPATSRRANLQGWASVASVAFGAVGWAGFLDCRQGGSSCSSSSVSSARTIEQAEVEATELGAAAARLGLGADRVEDATSWELSFFARTLNSVRDRCPREAQLLFHYTDLPSAEAIVAGHRGLRLSRGGYRGGGVFFSRLSPLEDQNMGRDPALLWRSAFPRFQAKQLQRNYGSDIVGRNTKVDAVLLCVVPSSMIEDLPDRKDAAFIPLERFETFGAEYFAYRNIPRAYRLAPQEAWLQGRRSRVQSSYE